MFDSSVVRGENITFGLNQVIPGWTEGLQLMSVGETRRLWIPEALAYRGQPGRPKGMLVFDVSLYSFKASPKPPQTPSDVAGVPADAEVTASGLASRMLKAGPGGLKPKATDRVTVNCACTVFAAWPRACAHSRSSADSGWTTAGDLFDSSIPRGEPTSFPLNRVIAGWTEGLQLMNVGESRRFWIPAELAYGVNPPAGAPAGMLVFDVDLLSVN
jgi:peptidylprolyl isomerase